MINLNDNWKFGSNNPDKSGWYGILILYDPNEEGYAEVEYWTGNNWLNDCSFIVGHSRECFDSEDVAFNFVQDNRPADFPRSLKA